MTKNQMAIKRRGGKRVLRRKSNQSAALLPGYLKKFFNIYNFNPMQNNQKKWKVLPLLAFIALIPLLLTLLAIWHWKPGAFVLAFVLMLGAGGLMYELLKKKKMTNKVYRFAAIAALMTVFGLVWMNVATGGILGDDPANMMYFGVLLIGLSGAILARLEARGMSRALFAMAFAIVLIPAIALIIGTPAFANGVAAVFGLHAFFGVFFVGSGLLFRRAEVNLEVTR
jgi:MFS family permease